MQRLSYNSSSKPGRKIEEAVQAHWHSRPASRSMLLWWITIPRRHNVRAPDFWRQNHPALVHPSRNARTWESAAVERGYFNHPACGRFAVQLDSDDL